MKVSRCYDTRLPCTCNFTSGRPQIFRALSGLPAPARRRFKSPIIFFISLRQTQKKLFCLLFKLILIFCFTFTTCELCLYFLNWVFQLKMSSKLSTYARKQKAQRWLQVDGEMQIAKSRHSKIFSVRSGIEMSVMRRQTEISTVPSSRTHKEIPVSAAVTSTAPKLPDVAC